MPKMKDLIHWQTVSGDPIVAGDVTLTPQIQALTIRWPPYGGLVWSRPVAAPSRRR